MRLVQLDNYHRKVHNLNRNLHLKGYPSTWKKKKILLLKLFIRLQNWFHLSTVYGINQVVCLIFKNKKKFVNIIKKINTRRSLFNMNIIFNSRTKMINLFINQFNRSNSNDSFTMFFYNWFKWFEFNWPKPI